MISAMYLWSMEDIVLDLWRKRSHFGPPIDLSNTDLNMPFLLDHHHSLSAQPSQSTMETPEPTDGLSSRPFTAVSHPKGAGNERGASPVLAVL